MQNTAMKSARRWPWSLLALATLLSTSAWAAPVTRSHPLPVQLDGAFAPSQIYVRYTSDRLDQPYEVWRGQAASPADQVFVQLMDGLRSGDEARVRPLLDLRPLRGSTSQAITKLRAAFGDFAQVRMISHAQVAGRDVYFFRQPRAQGVFTAGFDVYPQNGRLVAQLVTGNRPLASLIAYALDGEARSPGQHTPVTDANKGWSVPLDEAGSVRIEFDAQVYDLDPFAAPAALPSPAVGAWVQAAQQMRAGEWLAMAQAYTPASQQKIREWFGRVDTETKTQTSAVLTQGLRLKVAIPLGPTGSLLICSQGDTADRAEHVLRYVWVADTPDGPRLSNYFKRYALGAAFAKADGWPKLAGQLDRVLRRDRKGGR